MNALLPVLLLLCVLYGVIRRVPVYEAFLEGARQGLRVLGQVLPTLFVALLLVNLVRQSGLLGRLAALLGPPMRLVGVPEEILPLALFRPLSGSAALAALLDIFENTGPDSHAARAASALMGSSETVFYTLAVYLGSVGVKRSRAVVPVALVSGFLAMLAACWLTAVL